MRYLFKVYGVLMADTWNSAWFSSCKFQILWVLINVEESPAGVASVEPEPPTSNTDYWINIMKCTLLKLESCLGFPAAMFQQTGYP